jgi:hypothetical protein
MNVLVCSHLLRDIEQVCDEAVIMKDGMIVHHCNLEEERRSNRCFVELEVTGDDRRPAAALPEIGAEGVSEGAGRWRIVLPPGRRGRSHLGTRGAAEPAGEEAHAPPGHAGGDLPESHGAPGARDARRGRRALMPELDPPFRPCKPARSPRRRTSATGWRSTSEAIGDTRAPSPGAGRGSWCCPATPGGGSTSSGSSSCSRCWRSCGPSCAPASSISPITRSCCRGSTGSFAQFIQVDGRFFAIFMYVQAGFAVFLAALAGPGLIAPDLANNALPLYFSRPLTRWSYASPG